MDPALLARLKSSDPTQRREAIIALGKAADPAALPALAEVYRGDPLPELRDLALKAGRYVQQQNRAGPAGDSGGAKAGELRRVSPQDIERARWSYNRALDARLEGDNPLAASELARALDINPTLADDQPARNLAGMILGLPPEQAMQILADPIRREAYIGDGPPPGKRKRAVPEGRVATWGDVSLDMAALFVVQAICLFLLIVLILPRAVETLSSTRYYRYAYTDINPALFNIPPVAALVIALIVGVCGVVGQLISNGIVHVVARGLGGYGTLTQTYHALTPIQVVMMAAEYASYGLTASAPETQFLLCLLSLAISIGGTYWLSKALARVHGIGGWSGCIALIVGPLLLGILIAIGTLVLFSALGSALFQVT
jgi:hypothetical protein